MKMFRTALARHVTAVAVVLLTFAAKGPIERLVGPGPPLMFFMPAVTISAWQGGGGPGLLATALAAPSAPTSTSRRSGRWRSPIRTTSSAWWRSFSRVS